LLLNLSIAYAQCQRWNESIDASERLIELEPENEDGYHYLAFAYTSVDRDAEAIEVNQKVLRINPDSFYAIANLGLSYLKTEKLQEAATAFRQAINLNSQEAEVRQQEASVRVRLGETYVKLGDLSAAREQLRILAEVDPKAAEELSQIIAAAPEATAGRTLGGVSVSADHHAPRAEE
jgi:tetratricopeptide (TPR) repeat protein